MKKACVLIAAMLVGCLADNIDTSDKSSSSSNQGQVLDLGADCEAEYDGCRAEDGSESECEALMSQCQWRECFPEYEGCRDGGSAIICVGLLYECMATNCEDIANACLANGEDANLCQGIENICAAVASRTTENSAGE